MTDTPLNSACPKCKGFGTTDTHDTCPTCFGLGDLNQAAGQLIEQCAASSMAHDDPLVVAARRILANGEHLRKHQPQ